MFIISLIILNDIVEIYRALHRSISLLTRDGIILLPSCCLWIRLQDIIGLIVEDCWGYLGCSGQVGGVVLREATRHHLLAQTQIIIVVTDDVRPKLAFVKVIAACTLSYWIV